MANSIDAILAIEKANRLNIITDIVRSLGQARGYDRYILFAASSSYERIVKQIYWIGGTGLTTDRKPPRPAICKSALSLDTRST